MRQRRGRRRSRSRSRSRDARRRPRDGGRGASAAEPSRSASWDPQAELDSLHKPPVGSDDSSATSAEDDFKMYPDAEEPDAVAGGAADGRAASTGARLLVDDPELAEILRSPVPPSGDGECEGS